MTIVGLKKAVKWNNDPSIRRQSVCENESNETNCPSQETRFLGEKLNWKKST